MATAVLMSFINNCVFYKTENKEGYGPVSQAGMSLCTSWGALDRIPVHKHWVSTGCCFLSFSPNPTNSYGVMLEGCDEVGICTVVSGKDRLDTENEHAELYHHSHHWRKYKPPVFPHKVTILPSCTYSLKAVIPAV